MTSSVRHLRFVVLLFALALSAGPVEAATLTVTPPLTSNMYSGTIVLDIGGITNGEKVIIQKYLDLNGNGSIDAGEPLVDMFKIVDGGAMVIGGVTNVSVPFDHNSAPGAITTSLSFISTLVFDNMVGHFVYQVSSPTANWPAVTAAFAVTNAALGQWITGTVYSNGVPFPNAVVVVQDQQANNPVGGVVADGSGYFTVALPPSGYALIAGGPNLHYDFSTAPFVTLTNGMTSTNDLQVTSGTTVVSGKVYDTANSNGVGGVLMTLESGDLFAIALTDANGNYSTALPPSFWKIKAAKERLGRRAYLVADDALQVDATGGDVSNANVPLWKGTALFYGRITDASNTPFANVEIDVGTSGQGYSGKGFSDANGYYAAAVLGDGTNWWSCDASSGKSSALSSYVVNTYDLQVLTGNETVRQDFVALPATGRISGHVQDNSSNAVSGVKLSGNALINGKNYQTVDGTTDDAGNYSLGVAGGQWNVYFLTGGFSDNLDSHGYVDLANSHSVSIPPTNVTMDLIVYPIGTPLISQLQRMSSNQVGFMITGSPNVSYTVQVCTDLAMSNWTNLFSLQLTNNNVFVTDQHATNSPRFYRVMKQGN